MRVDAVGNAILTACHSVSLTIVVLAEALRAEKTNPYLEYLFQLNLFSLIEEV